MAPPSAARAGTFRIADALPVHRLGYGAMRITGDGIWGPPRNIAECRRVLARLPELGINFIDTADSYGPYISEDLLGEVLHPYPQGMIIATKGGLTRAGPGVWLPVGRPEYLRQCVMMSLRRLKLDRLPLWQLHRIDPKVPRDEQFACIAEMQREGLIEHVGLSEVKVEEIETARRHFTVASVQNLYNLVNRQSEEVLSYCENESIAFIPWFPLAAGSLARSGAVLDTMAQRLGVTPSALALAWVLQRSKVMLPIPGTGQVQHLEENMAAAGLTLSTEDFAALDLQGRAEWDKQKR